MKLADMIRFGPDATATVATVATLRGGNDPSVARVATVAVANHAARHSDATWTTDDRQASFEERAAIIEYDGGVPRAWAEGFARLDPNCPPIAVSVGRWQAVINEIGLFLDQWAAEAIAKGWDAADIFGADALRPGVTWLNSGPLWFGDGAQVVAVHHDRIVLETQSGAHQTYCRRPHMRARALPWELQ